MWIIHYKWEDNGKVNKRQIHKKRLKFNLISVLSASSNEITDNLEELNYVINLHTDRLVDLKQFKNEANDNLQYLRSVLEHLNRNIKENSKICKDDLRQMKLDFERFINEIKNDLIQNKKENYNSLNE